MKSGCLSFWPGGAGCISDFYMHDILRQNTLNLPLPNLLNPLTDPSNPLNPFNLL